MAAAMHTRVMRAFAGGTLTPASPLTDVPGAGPYLAARLTAVLRRPPEAPPATVHDLWRAFATRNTEWVVRAVHRALQNARGNQCVHAAVPREADGAARSTLEAAMRRRDLPALKAALQVMAERGLDCDDASIDAARSLLTELSAPAPRGGRGIIR